MTKKIFYLFIGFVCILSSCTSSKISENKINPESIPTEFKCNNCVLLIQKREKGNNINKYIENSFKKNYTGKFEMALFEEIQNDRKYQDKKIYRFVLTDATWTHGNKTITTTTTTSNMGVNINKEIQYNYAYQMDFHLYDRLNDKSLPSMGVTSGVPAKAINRTSVLLNKKLLE